MEIRNYVFSIILASVIAGIVLTVVKTNSSYGFFIKLLSGLFVALTVITPWKNIHLTDISSYIDHWEIDASGDVDVGVNAYQEALRASITNRTEAYILEKASSMGMQLSASVAISDDHPPVPVSIEISGNVSPYNKAILKKMIADDLGIPEDAQNWN